MRTLFLLVLLILPLSVDAAVFELRGSVTADGTIVRLLVTPSQSVNAVEGTLRIPEGVTIDDLHIGESIIQNWLEVPEVEDDTIRFAGIVPGGFTGSADPGKGLAGPSTLFTFYATSEGIYTLEEAALYMNDGAGTRVAVPEEALTVTYGTQADIRLPDRMPPEGLSAEVFEDAHIHDGPLLLLTAYDNESGIDYFEVREGGGSWSRTEPIYIIEDTLGFTSIYVRAYDREGNFTEIYVPGRLQVPVLMLVLLLVALFAGAVYFLKHRRP